MYVLMMMTDLVGFSSGLRHVVTHNGLSYLIATSIRVGHSEVDDDIYPVDYCNQP